jgi:hypothetical protein
LLLQLLAVAAVAIGGALLHEANGPLVRRRISALL